MAEFNDVADKIIKQLSGTNVEMIFGESRQVGDKVIIPVGKVKYGWGGGGGHGTGPGKQGEQAEQNPEGEGMGMGMGVMVKPLGFITVTANDVRYDPIIDFGPLILIMAPIVGLALLKLLGSMKVMSKGMGCCKKYGFMHKGMHKGGFMHHRCGHHPKRNAAKFMMAQKLAHK